MFDTFENIQWLMKEPFIEFFSDILAGTSCIVLNWDLKPEIDLYEPSKAKFEIWMYFETCVISIESTNISIFRVIQNSITDLANIFTYCTCKCHINLSFDPNLLETVD